MHYWSETWFDKCSCILKDNNSFDYWTRCSIQFVSSISEKNEDSLLQDVAKDQQEAAPVLLQEGCSRKEEKPGAVGAHSTGRVQPHRPQAWLAWGWWQAMAIRQGKLMSQAKVHPDVHPDVCSGTLRDRAGSSLYTSREYVSPWGCSGLCRAVGACRTWTDESNALYGFLL